MRIWLLGEIIDEVPLLRPPQVFCASHVQVGSIVKVAFCVDHLLVS